MLQRITGEVYLDFPMAGMVCFQPYHDVPGIPEENLLTSETRNLSMLYVDSSDQWNPIDLVNGGARVQHGLYPDMSALRMHIQQLEKSANGETQHSFANGLDEKAFRPVFQHSWEPQDLYPQATRNIRYISPNGQYGGDVSVTDPDSSQSERSWSPRTSRGYLALHENQQDYHQSIHSPLQDYSAPPGFGNNYGVFFPNESRHVPSAGGHSVALKELQLQPDPEPETEPMDEDGTIEVTGAYAQQTKLFTDDDHFSDEALGESIHSVKDDESFEGEGCCEDNDSEYSPTKRARPQAQSRRSTNRRFSSRKQEPRGANAGKGNRISKPGHASLRRKGPQTSINTASMKSKKSQREEPADSRPFVCSFAHYGCDSTFGSKNEWKRHVMSQHLQLGFYRCDVGSCVPDHGRPRHSSHTRGHNDFNRKDLFTQHHRRMHCPWSPPDKPPSTQAKEEFEAGLELVRQRCFQQQRLPPQKSVCGFCEKLFEGPPSWDERMEHVGKHFEKGDKDEREDEELREWALRQGIITEVAHGRFRMVGKEGEAHPDIGDEDAEGEDE